MSISADDVVVLTVAAAIVMVEVSNCSAAGRLGAPVGRRGFKR